MDSSQISGVRSRLETDRIAKYLTDRIEGVEINFSTLCQDIAGISRKHARLRDKYDQFAKDLRQYADQEHTTVKLAINSYAECVAGLEDYRQVMIDRIEARVLRPLQTYSTNCKKARDNMKSLQHVRDKELVKLQAFDRVKIREPANKSKLTQYESEIQKTRVESERVLGDTQEQAEMFEKKKVEDLKKIFGDFLQTHMAFHAKALSLYTSAFQFLRSVDEVEQLNAFKQNINPH
ncbi:Protein FAM92A1 isoform X1 [Oopsacas minuta]|uniref:Protein FAM92A1 isoform X1 n=1 Tax=Oopsacas minuta TaxID=111878 RepID=A0AAV7JAE5_9METZ|nr:Protein FAM92A1 isoform X1 [Oopsacas minuta]